MSAATLASFGNRTLNGLQRLWRRIRKIKFRQVMGVIVILKTFNPLWLLLALALFAILTINDLREQYRPVFDQISTNYNAIVNEDLQGLQAALDGVRGALQALTAILSVVRSVVNGIVGFVNEIIKAIAWFFGLSNIDFRIQLPIPDFSQVFQPFNDLMIHFRGLFDGFVDFFTVTGTVLQNLWERFKLFFLLAVLWALLSIFASVYSEVTRGLEMIRGSRRQEAGERPPGASGALAGSQFGGAESIYLDTPPVIIVNQALVTIPVLMASQVGDRAAGDRAAGRQRTFTYQERYLLSAQGIWPDRHAPLFFQQLADRVDAGIWAQFWQSLIFQGLDPAGVQMVISADTSVLAVSVQRFLPQAEIQESVETTILTG